jgi:hypothetical protein
MEQYIKNKIYLKEKFTIPLTSKRLERLKNQPCTTKAEVVMQLIC